MDIQVDDLFPITHHLRTHPLLWPLDVAVQGLDDPFVRCRLFSRPRKVTRTHGGEIER